jgi:ubiquinone/menaquinone biosynthesis C-methylase UbiE
MRDALRSEAQVQHMFQQYYDAGAEGYDRLFGRVPQHFSAPLLRAARLAPGQHVLEVATGTGLIAAVIANAIGPSGQPIGVDISRGGPSATVR